MYLVNVLSDLGAPTINIDNATVNAYWGTVHNARRINDTNWATPCNARLPDLQFTSPSGGNVQQLIPGASLMGARIEWQGSLGREVATSTFPYASLASHEMVIPIVLTDIDLLRNSVPWSACDRSLLERLRSNGRPFLFDALRGV